MGKFETALHESESQKQAILESSEDIILLFDRNLRVLWASSSAAKLGPDPIGKRCHELFCRTTAKCEDCRIAGGFGKNVPSVLNDGMTVAAGGGDLFFRLTTAPVRERGGSIEKLVVTAHDITERLRLESQLRHASKMEAIGTLAGGIAHDFNNILTPIMGYAEIMRLNFLNNQLDREESISYVDQILAGAKRAQKLVEQILVFSRHSEINESLQPIHPIIKEGVKLIHATIPSTIEVRQEIDEQCGQVTVDPVEVHQILINLCKNAADAMTGRRGILKVSLRKSEYRSGAGRWLELSVADNGCGIPPEFRERIFDPYFTTKQKVQGTGMGLALVHGIVSRQGGRISVESVVGEGTTITVHLPVVEDMVNLENIIGSPIPMGSNEHILLIDDDKQVIESISEMLDKLGYRVTCMTSARAAVLEFAGYHAGYDLVITDLTMPYMSGIDLCEKIKAVRPDVPVLLFSGYLEDFSHARALEAGVDGFCLKPVSLAEIAKTIQELLAGH